MRAVLADGFFADGDARAVHQAVQAAEFLQRGVHRGLAVILAGHVALDVARVFAEPGGQRFALRFVDVGDDRIAAGCDDHFDSRCAEAGTAAGDDECAVPDFHVESRYWSSDESRDSIRVVCSAPKSGTTRRSFDAKKIAKSGSREIPLLGHAH